MLFNSFYFIFIFLPVTLIGYFVLNNHGKEKIAKAYLVLASLYFYAYFNYSYLILIMSSILVNYYIGNKIKHQNRHGGGELLQVTVRTRTTF